MQADRLLRPYLHMCGSQLMPGPWLKEEINSFSKPEVQRDGIVPEDVWGVHLL